VPSPAPTLASHDCDMLKSMYVRCAQCGYDNSPEFRFCGMCGGSLPHPPKEASQPERDVVLPPVAAPFPPPIRFSASTSGVKEHENVHGPSFLGLSDDRRDNDSSDYPDEEDGPKRGRAGLIAVLVLVIAAAGFLSWQWEHQGFPFNRSVADSNPAASPEAVPDASQNPATQAADKTVTGNGDQPAAAPDAGTPADSSAKSEAPAQGGAAASPSPDQTPPPGKTASGEVAPPARVAVQSRVKKPEPSKPWAKSSGVESASLATSPDADLELAGERYLYGTGLPQNCARAESSLGTAAAHGNPKAETVLGTMYATGHCVGRDLPTAYRWFARALHQDPQNPRISADLQVLWRQMTPEEKQLATTAAR
jgi:hypothetical protein